MADLDISFFVSEASYKRQKFELGLVENPEAFVTLGHRLQHIRRQMGLSKALMAECLGCQAAALWNEVGPLKMPR